jgi:hypothetical protein
VDEAEVVYWGTCPECVPERTTPWIRSPEGKK